ncbi:PepSY domain-containing protein [Stappia indica]|uniref:PepSY domain-containing protein n=1 Tax=Stappia indica TaxID=538381 RepID=UPI001CD19FD5|nr:PepSY domain-containing protein [Stappia indica]MCA1297544.1 PepSY domain-containing protein [Stappia indica]
MFWIALPFRRLRSGFAPAFRRQVAAVVLAAVAVLAVPQAAMAACLSPSQARAAVANGQAQPLGAIAGAVRGEIVRAELCEQGGRLVYRLSVLSGERLVTRVVDARTGQVLN